MEKGGETRNKRTEDELLERREDVDTPGHLDLVNLELKPLGKRAFGRHVDCVVLMLVVGRFDLILNGYCGSVGQNVANDCSHGTDSKLGKQQCDCDGKERKEKT